MQIALEATRKQAVRAPRPARRNSRHIAWIATANSLEGLSIPLLNRFQVIVVGRPDAQAAVTLALSVARAVPLQMGACLKPPSGEVLQFLAVYSARFVRRIWMDAVGQAVINGHDGVMSRNPLESHRSQL